MQKSSNADQEVHMANGKVGDNALNRVLEVQLNENPHWRILIETSALKIQQQLNVHGKYFTGIPRLIFQVVCCEKKQYCMLLA